MPRGCNDEHLADDYFDQYVLLSTRLACRDCEEILLRWERDKFLEEVASSLEGHD